MADTNEEIIGGIGVTITGDYSSLAAGYSTAQSQAETAGQALAEAFNEGVSAVSDAAEVVTAALSGIGPAAEEASGSITALGDAIDSASATADDLADSAQNVADFVTQAGGAAEEAADSVEALGESAVEAASSTGDLGDQAAAAVDSVSDLGDESNDAASGMDDISTSASDADGSLSDLASSAGDAASAAGDLGDELPDAGDGADELSGSSEEASNSLESMAEQMVAVGEALVITEGMIELGQEALQAADSITTASIALTNITGSASSAQESIEGLEQLGMSDGLAMPSLLTAATRMTQMLPPGTDVVTLLGKIADGAVPMGTSIDAAANTFDRITNSTTLSAKMLGTFGLTLTSVAAAMNQVDPSADATAASVSKLWGTLDQTQHITILQTALQGLAGTAQQVAQETFQGQWQSLADAWEQIMVQVGQAILPVISDLVQFTKTDILPFVKEMVSDFNALPGPVKDTAVAVALLVAAAIPLTGIAAAAAIGLNGLAEAATLLGLGASEAAVAGLGDVAAGAEVAGGAAIGATEAVGAAGLAGGLAGVSAAALPVSAAVVILASHFGDLKDTFLNVTGTAVALGQNIASTAIPAIEQLGSEAAIAVDPTNRAQAAWALFSTAVGNVDPIKVTLQYINLLTDGVQQLSGVTPGATQMTAAMTAELNKLQTAGTQSETATDALAASMKAALSATQGLNGGLTPLQISVDAVVTSVAAAQTKFDQARNTFNALNQSMLTGTPIYNGLTASAAEVAKAHQDMDAAAKAAGISLAPIPGSMDAITAAANKLADSTGFVVSAQQQQTNEQAVANSSLDLATEAYNRSATATQLAVAQLNGLTIADDGSIASRQAIIGAEENVQKAYAASQKAQTDLATTQSNWATQTTALIQTAAQKQLSELQDLANAVGPDIAQFSGLQDAIQNLQSTLPNFGVVTVNISTGPLAGLQSALAESTNNVAKLQAQMNAGQNVGTQYEKALNAELTAQINLNVATAEAGTGLQGATDAYSLATIAVAAAQAKLDTLNQAYQTNITLAPQVAAAQKALTTAQDDLNTAAGQGTNLVDQLNAAYPNLTTTIGGATSAIQTQTTALAADVTQLQSVAAAVQSIEADFASASGAASAASGGGDGSGSFSGGGAGWRVGITGFGSFGQPLYETIYTPNLTQQDFDNIVAQYGLAYAEQVEAGYNQMGYSDNYTPTVVSSATGATTSTGATTAPEALNQMYTASAAGLSTTAATDTTGVGGLTDPLAAAEAVVAALNALPGGGATSTLAEQIDQLENIIINSNGASGFTVAQAGQLQSLLNQAGLTASGTWASGGSTSGSSSTTSTTPATTSASGSGTGAIDGGSYPAVTAHQASGEVWAVSTSGASVASGGTVASTSTITENVTSTAGSTDLTSAVSAVGGAVQEVAASGEDLLTLGTSVAAVATATEAIATAVGGLVTKISTSTGATSSSGAPATVGSSSGEAAPTGSPTLVSEGPGYGYLPTSPITGLPTAGSGTGAIGSAPQQVSANVTVNVNGGGSTQSQIQQIAQAVQIHMVAALRTAGARF